MELTRPDWETQRLARRTMIPIVRQVTPLGDRVFGFTRPNVGDALVGGFFSADVDYDHDVFFNPDGLYLERSSRLLTVSGIEHGVRTLDSAVLGSWGQAETPRATYTVTNGDKKMSQMIGEEYIINQVSVVLLTFPTLDVLDALQVREGRVQRWTLTSAKLTVELAPI